MEIHRSKIFCLGLTACLVVILASGCARTVTPVVTYGDQMVVEVTLRGSIDVQSNRYFLVLSSNPDYKVPLPPPDQIEDLPEFIEPGMIPTTGSQEGYYSNFYSTWAGYAVVDENGISLAKGPFSAGVSPTREAIANLVEGTNKVNFSFRLGRIFDTIPDKVYFDFVVVPWPDGDAKIPADHLPSTNNYIMKIAGSFVSFDDLTDSSLGAALDILGCKVEIQ